MAVDFCHPHYYGKIKYHTVRSNKHHELSLGRSGQRSSEYPRNVPANDTRLPLLCRLAFSGMPRHRSMAHTLVSNHAKSPCVDFAPAARKLKTRDGVNVTRDTAPQVSPSLASVVRLCAICLISPACRSTLTTLARSRPRRFSSRNVLIWKITAASALCGTSRTIDNNNNTN